MQIGSKPHAAPVAVPLQSAVLCADCECITIGRSSECAVCGSKSLFSMARLIGGAQQSSAAMREKPGCAVVYDVEIAIGLKEAQLGEMSNALENIAIHIAPWLARGQAACHIDVKPIASESQVEKKAA
jgi:hypothetical protein